MWSERVLCCEAKVCIDDENSLIASTEKSNLGITEEVSSGSGVGVRVMLFYLVFYDSFHFI